MRQGGAVVRDMSSGNQVRVGQWGATSRTCSSSSLSLHSVCASRLTGGNAYLRKARGQLCASVSVPRGPSVREKYSWQWEDSGEANRSTWASTPDQPDRLGIATPGNESCRESASAARLSFPGMWTARSDSNCVGLQRRRWWAGCDMRCDRIPPSRLMYETAAVLSVRTSMCLPNSSGWNCRKAKFTAHSSRQLMCQSSRGPVQSPEAACPLHVAPQPVLEASFVTTVCRDTCSRGTQVAAFRGHRCTAIALSTWGMPAYPLATPPSRVVRMEEANEGLLAVKVAIHDFVSSSCTSGKKGTGAGHGCEPRPLRETNRPAARAQDWAVCWPPARCSRLPGQAWLSALGPVQQWRQHPRGAAPPHLHPQRTWAHPPMLRSTSYLQMAHRMKCWAPRGTDQRDHPGTGRDVHCVRSKRSEGACPAERLLQ